MVPYWCLCDWLTSLSTSPCVPAVAVSECPSFLMLILHRKCMHILFTLCAWWMGCFHLWAVVISATVNLGITNVCLWAYKPTSPLVSVITLEQRGMSPILQMRKLGPRTFLLAGADHGE